MFRVVVSLNSAVGHPADKLLAPSNPHEFLIA